MKKEHPDWDMKHVEAAAYGYCKDKLGIKDSKFQDKAIKWISSFGTEVTVHSLDDVNEIFSELEKESDKEAQEFLDYFSVAKNWSPLYKTLYHGSNVPPTTILAEGLDAETFLTTDIDIAKGYGEYVYEIAIEDLPPDTMVQAFPRNHVRIVVVGGETNPITQVWQTMRSSTVSVDRWR